MKAHLYSVWPIATPVSPVGNSVWEMLRPQMKGEEPLQHHHSVRYRHPLHYCTHTHIGTHFNTVSVLHSMGKCVCVYVCLLLSFWILWWFSVLCLTELTKLTTYLLQLLLKRHMKKVTYTDKILTVFLLFPSFLEFVVSVIELVSFM